jgi:ankyrin repeat protein
MIDTEMVSLPADIIGWRGHSALSILASTFNRVEAFSNSSPWKQPIPPGSPLHWSIRTNNISAVKLLIENEADVNQVDSSGQTPMSLAVSSRHPVKILRELLQAGAGIAEPSRNRIVAMQFAIRRGDMEVVKILAEADPETLKQVDKFSADRLVRDAGSTEVFQYLVSLGSDPFREIDFTDSAITFHLGTKSSLRWFILSSGLVSQSSEAPLARLLASAAVTGDSGNILLIKKLYRTLSRSVFKKVVNRARLDIGSPLCLAASMNAAEMLKSLITMGTELESEGCRYGTPLMAACVWGNLDAVRCLVRAGALLCYANEEGLLRSAVSLSSRYEKITRWLLVDRYTDQQKLEYQSSRSTPHQAVWSGPRPFKVALPVDMHRDFGESRWSHLQRLQEWKEELLGSTLSESCRNSGLDFDAECEAESRQSIAQGMQRQFLARLGEDGCK